jgi:RNA 2',3'-cyclic 3'-phosphodiesterase
MRLFAAIVPPAEAVDELRTLVRSVRPEGEDLRPSRTRRRLFGRGDRPAAVADDEIPDTDQLQLTPTAEMFISITSFGNVALGDSVKLVDALRADAATRPAPTLHFAGGAALEWRGDESVWAKLGGDVDGLSTIGRGVPQVVQRLGFFVDRRQFRPWLPVGTITDTTTAPYLEELVAALEGFEGRPWTQATLTVMKRLPDGDPDAPFKEVEQMPLAAS